MADTFFYRFRFYFAGIFTLGFLLIIAAVVTAVGASTVLAKGTTPSSSSPVIVPNTPNAVTVGAYKLTATTKSATFTVGSAVYKTCESITATTTRSGKAVADGTYMGILFTGRGIAFAGKSVVRGYAQNVRFTADSIVFAGRTVASGFVLIGHTFGSIFGFASKVTRANVNSVIQPANDKQVPIITTSLSPAVLAHAYTQAQQIEVKQKIKQLRQSQITANKDLDGTVVAGDPNHGGYPAKWDAPVYQDSRLDSWGMYNRECVSYTAWKVYQTFGHMPYWGGVGNANEWPADARAAGISTGHIPVIHSVAISMRGYYGHSMWVEKVRGNMIYVSQYNYDLAGHYSEMWVNGSSFTYIYFQ